MIDIFEGGHPLGRVGPMITIPGIYALPVQRNTGRFVIQQFEERGSSIHSALAATLWVTLTHCFVNKIPFNMEAHPDVGYVISKIVTQASEEIKTPR